MVYVLCLFSSEEESRRLLFVTFSPQRGLDRLQRAPWFWRAVHYITQVKIDVDFTCVYCRRSSALSRVDSPLQQLICLDVVIG